MFLCGGNNCTQRVNRIILSAENSHKINQIKNEINRYIFSTGVR